MRVEDITHEAPHDTDRVCCWLRWSRLAGVVASMVPASRTAPPPIFVAEIPAGYRDWRLISVAREEGTLDDIRAVLGNDVAIKTYREGTASVPGRHHHCANAWSYDPSEENNKVFCQPCRPILRGRAPEERGAVHGQGLEKIRLDGRLGLRAIRRRQTCRRGDAQNLLSLSRAIKGRVLRLHPVRTVMNRGQKR